MRNGNQLRLESLKDLAEQKQKKSKNSKGKPAKIVDDLAKLSLVDALGGMDFGSPKATDTSFYDLDCALAARVNFNESEFDESF